ncbi:unnamed protein product [Lactuca saligna]|uniref:Uncharacterized protein n=1 Tax=Lactuca saligna TaxID=75948 RepID=A0AA35Z0E7_LACSI|nr:unnamed protein product [Lactuca saligna]
MDSGHINSSSSTSSRRTCLCSPTNHPGSFRCARHRSSSPKVGRKLIAEQLNRLDIKKTNLVKEFLLKIIKPSSHDIQRRKNFEPKPSRFSVLDHCSHGGKELVVS